MWWKRNGLKATISESCGPRVSVPALGMFALYLPDAVVHRAAIVYDYSGRLVAMPIGQILAALIPKTVLIEGHELPVSL
jgi:hypothetical protein